MACKSIGFFLHSVVAFRCLPKWECGFFHYVDARPHSLAARPAGRELEDHAESRVWLQRLRLRQTKRAKLKLFSTFAVLKVKHNCSLIRSNGLKRPYKQEEGCRRGSALNTPLPILRQQVWISCSAPLPVRPTSHLSAWAFSYTYNNIPIMSRVVWFDSINDYPSVCDRQVTRHGWISLPYVGM